MKPKSIGIIGGAGPLAGAFLLEKVLSIANKTYGCYKDSDFPKILLISFPFSEMLSSIINTEILKRELHECLDHLRNNGASVIAIACNTLHAFLDPQDEQDDLVHLPRALAQEILPSENPLVLCTSTSARFGLHQRFFPCMYPDLQTQHQVDEIIDQILRGADKEIIIKRLQELLNNQESRIVILGCTELSIFATDIIMEDKLIIDPLEVVANKILEKIF